jgi:hypothetical protein
MDFFPRSPIPYRSWHRTAIAAVLLAIPRGAAHAQLRADDQPQVVHGTVVDSISGTPIRLATVRVNGGAGSTLTNDAGQFSIGVAAGTVTLDVRRIGFQPLARTIVVSATGAVPELTLRMERFAVGLNAVVSTAADDFARRLITAAIARKQQLRGQLHDYRYQAHVRLVVDRLRPSATDSASRHRGAMEETVTSAYWERPDHFQEHILARRETDNISAERNLLGAREIEDFSRDRIAAGPNSLVSPIADDALDHYQYRVLDTLTEAGRRVFRLSLEPTSDRFAAFIGTIDVVDSTFDVAGFDVGVNAATDVGRLRDYRYQQQFSQESGGRWMPTLITITADVQIPFPFGGADDRAMINYSAALDSFVFNGGAPPAGLGEYRILVDDRADHPDSAVWKSAPQLPPQATAARDSGRPDSVSYTGAEHGPTLADAIRLVRTLDLFHFTRVDGWYFGASYSWHDLDSAPWMVPTVKAGYALGSKRWEYRVGDQFELSQSRRMWVGASYHDETITRPGITADSYNPSLRAVIAGPRGDGLDYYRERGVVASFSTKLIDLTQLDLAYTYARQSSLALLPRYAARDTGRRAPIPNRPIDDGRLGSLSATISYDSRPMIRQRGEDRRVASPTGTRVTLSAEGADPSTLGGDFEYRRYTLRVERAQELFGWGTTTVSAVGGVGSNGLPAQRYFAISGGARILQTTSAPFSTLRDSVFAGNRVAALSLDHNFGRTLFLRSGLPGIRDVPFTFGVHAGVFWTSFEGTGTAARDSALTSHGLPYREVGVSLGNLTPFLGIVDLGVRFGWQLSAFPTARRRLEIGFGRR